MRWVCARAAAWHLSPGTARLNRQARRTGGLAVDEKLEPGRLLDRQAGRRGAFEDAVDVTGTALVAAGVVGAITRQQARFSADAVRANGRPARDVLPPIRRYAHCRGFKFAAFVEARLLVLLQPRKRKALVCIFCTNPHCY